MAQGPSSSDSGSDGGAADGSAAASDPKASLAEALKRLNNALDELDRSASASLEARNKTFSTDEQVQRMGEDRARLARDLDDAEARAVALKEVNSDVSRRLVNAMEMVRGVIDKQGS